MSNQIENKNQTKSGEDRKKGRLSLIRRILKWVGLAILSLLLILAIVFQAPWKVITLLAIIFLACTILPKQFRKWFWLSAAAIVVILIIWVFLPDDTEGWRPYTFEEELSAIQAKYAVPDTENAAIIYNQLLKDYNESTVEPHFLDPNLEYLTRSGPWTSNEYPQVAEWIKGHENTITKLIEASKFEKCRFPIVADVVSLGEHMQPLSKWRHCAFLLVSAANNDVGEGRIDAALEKWLCLIQMSTHIRQQPTMINMLVGIAIEALATNQFNRFVVTGDATEEHLNVIEKAITEIKHDWSTDFPRFLEHERLFAKNFGGMFYEVNPEEKTRLTRGLIRTIMAQLPQDMKDEMVITYWHKRIMKAWTILGWFFMPSTPKKAGRIIDECYEKYYAMADPNFVWQKKSPAPFSMLKFCCQIRFNYRYFANFMADMAIEPLYGVRDLYLRLLVENRGSQIIIALRRYKNKTGNWPESIDDVKPLAPAEIFVDPINGSSFVYKLTEENFTLYSKGKNNIDEGGKRDRWDEEKTEADDWLIWPARSRATQEKTEDAE